MDKLASTFKMSRTLLACALFLWTAVRCDADAYSVDNRGRIDDDDDAGKTFLTVFFEIGRKRLWRE